MSNSKSNIVVYWGNVHEADEPVTEGTRILDINSDKRFEIKLSLFEGLTSFQQRERLVILTRQIALLMKSYDKEDDHAEDNIRETFNSSFSLLQEAKSAGSIYAGDNGCYILEFLDVNEREQCLVLNYLEKHLSASHCLTPYYKENSLQVFVC